MNRYSGAATMWLADGRRFAASAILDKDQGGSWRGTLVFANDDHLPVLVNVREATLHVEGAFGDFIRPDSSDWTVDPRGPFRIRIEGSGTAPF
ncbi:hypothetical protein [Streptomyces murinus]|uniref:hypothetical protein n=1 Tax=Streptomyces murinus TaxID=33900 RepID=UPI003F447DD8